MNLSNTNSDTEYYFEQIEKYVASKEYIGRISEVIQQGMQIFAKYPNAKAVSLFTLKENSPEFEFRAARPSSQKEEHILLFDKLTEIGIVGTALGTGEITIDYIPDSKSEAVVLVPLIASWGVIGLIVIEIETYAGFDNASNLANRLTAMLAGLFAGSIENSTLFKNLNTAKTVLEQKIASRTMDLTQSRRELNAILDSVQAGILVYDVGSKSIKKVNPVAINLIDSSADDILGKPISDFLQEVDSPEQMSSPESQRNFESSLKSSTGKIIPIIRTTSYVNLGTTKHRVDCFLDITEQKKFEEELRKYNEMLELKVEERTFDLQILVQRLKDEIQEHSKAQKELKIMLNKEKELSEMKTRFVSMVSHEFRTPLTVIRSAAQMLVKFKNSLPENEKEDYLNRVVRTVDILTDLIENVLFIGRQESHNEQPPTSQVDLVAFTENIISEFKMTLLKKREVSFDYAGTSSDLLVNEKLLRLILVNLISNAAKYSPPESPIEVKLYFDSENFVYKVRDFGIGIPEEEQQKIFSLFYRADNVGGAAGTGIGLSVVLNSIQSLNGKIDLASKVGEGTTFTVTIPSLKAT